MAEHERASRNKQAEVDQKRRVSQKESQPLFDKVHAWELDKFSMPETPFQPRMDEHTELLSSIHADEEKANLLINLQRTYGNGYVQRLMKSIAVQPKLTVNAPNDIYEQEADRVADRVSGNIGSQIQRQEEEEEELQTKPILQRQPEEEEEELQTKPVLQRQPTEEEEVQTKPVESQPTAISDVLEAKINEASGSGQPISEDVRIPMESIFGADFSGVKVHIDTKADVLSQSLQARAFTTGNNIFFKDGEYNPNSSSGQKLLAHELSHTLQQRSSHKIARWWDEGHGVITWLAGLQSIFPWGKIDDSVIDFLATRAGDMDARVGNIANMIAYSGIWSPQLVKKYKQHQEAWILAREKNPSNPKTAWWVWNKDKMKEKWDKTDFQQRFYKERLNHGEGGGYGKYGDGVAANKAKVLEWTDDAVKYYKKDRWQSFTLLSRALHLAEDRGAHGEGNEWAGHDPRISAFEYDWQGLPNPNYNPEWDPDDPSKNSAGWQAAIIYAKDVFEYFVARVQAEYSNDEEIDVIGMLGLSAQQRENRSVSQAGLDAANKAKENPKYNQMLRQNPEVAKLIDEYLGDFHRLAWLKEKHPDKVDSILNIESKLKEHELDLALYTDMNHMGTPGLGKTWNPDKEG